MSGPLRIAIAPIGAQEISQSYKDKGASSAEVVDAERRGAYRVDSGGLSVWVVGSGGREIVGGVHDVSGTGAAVEVSASVAKGFDEGDAVRLRFHRGGWLKHVELEGALISTETAGANAIMRVSFAPGATDALEGPGLRETFNRRRSVRVQPDPEEVPLDVDLTLVGSTGGSRVVPADLSVHGLGLRASDLGLAVGQRVAVRVHLPLESEPVAIEGVVRNRRKVGGEDRVGIEFDREAFTGTSDGARQALLKYVQTRVGAG